MLALFFLCAPLAKCANLPHPDRLRGAGSGASNQVNAMRIIPLVAALALLPTFAPAEVLFSGQAKMGLRHESGKTSYAAGTRVTTQFSGTTDGGLEFGAIIDLDQTATGMGSVFDSNDPRAQVYISGGDHSLTLGKGTPNAVQGLFD